MNIPSPIKRVAHTLWRHKWKTLLAIVVILPVSLAAYSLSQPKPAEYVTEEAKTGDITQIVEAVGTLTSDRDLDLQFKTSGIVAEVTVKEGQKVRAGQRLATLRAGSLSAGIASASASVREAEAQLRALREGSRPEDIAISEATVANKRASLEAARTTLANAEASAESARKNLDQLQSEADTNLAGQVQTAVNIVNEKLVRAEQALLKVDDVLGYNDVQDAILRSTPGGYDSLLKQKTNVRKTIDALRNRPLPTDYQGALQTLSLVRSALNESSFTVGNVYSLVAALPETSYLTNADRESYKADLATEKNAVLTAISSLDSSVTALQNASATYATRISSEEASLVSAQGLADKARSDIQTYQTSLAIDEANLRLVKAGARQTDIDAADARVRQARASLARASAEYGDTVLIAPVDGTVTEVNVKPGELTPIGSAVSLLGSAPLRVEMFVSEVDVPKIKLTQTGSIELDAFKDVKYTLRVSEVAAAPTDIDGVSKFKVMLDFVYPHDEVKVGMTGDTEIVTGASNDVVFVPLRSVLQDAEGQKIVRILGVKNKIEDRFVETGLEGDGGVIEVSNVEPGEKVIVLVKQ
jgi:multidrug efflux pump subunit AcrA (membrane-fusion protein)